MYHAGSESDVLAIIRPSTKYNLSALMDISQRTVATVLWLLVLTTALNIVLPFLYNPQLPVLEQTVEQEELPREYLLNEHLRLYSSIVPRC